MWLRKVVAIMIAAMGVVCFGTQSNRPAMAADGSIKANCVAVGQAAKKKAASAYVPAGYSVITIIVSVAIDTAVTLAAQTAGEEAEAKCLAEHGLGPARPVRRAQAGTRGSTGGSISHGPSNSAGKCACPEMHTCTGNWVTLSCSKLKEICGSSGGLAYTKNSCDKFKQLVRN